MQLSIRWQSNPRWRRRSKCKFYVLQYYSFSRKL